MTEPDTTEKVEKTDVGYRLSITSTRGTGTRDQDKVKAEARAETLKEVLDDVPRMLNEVETVMNKRRAHQPDEEDDNDE